MNFRDLLATPYPQHAFALDGGSLTYACLSRKRDAFERTEQIELPVGWCSLGPLGLLQVDREAVARAVGEIVARLGKRPQRATLVIPNGWVRSVAVDVGTVPRQRQEAEDVIRWRLKKLLPCRPEDVRLDYLPAGDNGRVMVMLALDRPLGFIEEAFAGAGVHLGRVIPSSAALLTLLPADQLPRLLAVVEGSALALVGVVGGSVRLLRNKGLPADGERLAPLLHRELSQTVAYLREYGGDDVLEVHLASTDRVVTEAVTDWALARSDVVVRPFPADASPAAAQPAGDLKAWMLYAAGRERVR